MIRFVGGLTMRSVVVFGLIALLGGYALAAAAANTAGTVGGQGLSATVVFFRSFAGGYQDASQTSLTPTDPSPAPAPKASRQPSARKTA